MDSINSRLDMRKTDKLKVVFGDVTLGVGGEEFHYIFSYQTKGLESLVYQGKEWLYRTPKPTFFRATTDNDRGCNFHLQSGMWLSADMFMSCNNIKVHIDDKEITNITAPDNNVYTDHETADNVKVTFTYETITIPSTEIDVTYEVNNSGKLTVTVHYHGKEGLPSLPLFGMRFIMPTKAVAYEYEGLSGETYPDRMAGGIEGRYLIEGLPVTPYLVPQDCNVHMDTKSLVVYRTTTLNNADRDTKKYGLKFACVDKKFAFSCIPYTAQELENATHQEELPPARRTVVSILGAVRGVGGINSWGAEVEEEYRIDAKKDIEYSFTITNAAWN